MSLVLNGVVTTLTGLVQGVHDLTTVVGVGGGAACGEAQVVTGNDAVDIAAADAAGCLGGNAAGTHRADTAAGTCFAETAVGGLVLDTILPNVNAYLLRRFEKASGVGFHLFNSRLLEKFTHCCAILPM